MNKIALLEKVAREWNELGIEYAVAHGIDDYPERAGRDLDVLVRSRDIRVALDAARRVLESQAITVGIPPDVWGPRLIAALPGEIPDMIEIHLVRALSWTGAVLADRPQPVQRIGPFALDPWVSFVKRVMLPVLSGNASKLESHAVQRAFDTDELQAARVLLPAFIGSSLSAALLEHLARRDVSGLRPLAPSIRRALAIRGVTRHPDKALVLLARAVRRKIAQPFSPCAPIVAVIGPPGPDRMAIIRLVADGDLLIFTDCVVRHWDDDHASSGPSRSGARRWVQATRRAVRLSRRIVDDRFASMRQRLVLYDGCALDAAAFQEHRGDASRRGMSQGGRLFPVPDLLIVLAPQAASDAQIVHGSDATPSGRLATAHADVVCVDPAMPPDALRNLIMTRIAAAFVRRNRREQRGAGRSE